MTLVYKTAHICRDGDVILADTTQGKDGFDVRFERYRVLNDSESLAKNRFW